MPDDLNDDALEPDPQTEAVRAALGDLTFLAPDSADYADQVPADVMPAEVWARLEAALMAEATARSVATHENVVALPGTAAGPTTQARRPMRWAGGLVAASVAVVAVGIAVGTMRGGTSSDVVVAGDAPASVAATTAAPLAASAPEANAAAEAEAFSTPSLESARSSDADTGSAAGSAAGSTAPVGGASVTPAARMVLASKTNYTPEQLKGQVVSLVKNAGFQTPEEAVAKQMPLAAMPVEGGFTASWEALRACLTWLTQSSDSQALVVDRGTYDGTDAGVVVAPASWSADPDGASPSPTVTIDTRFGVFDVWVVNPDCEQVQTSLDDFPLYAWQP